MSYKKESNKTLKEYYKTHSIEDTIRVAKTMLYSDSYKDIKAFNAHVHGEICETVLELLVMDYMKKNPVKTKEWFYSKGLIIKDIDNPSNGYFTELDLTVFTPQKIFAFECKSYGGDKKITQKCMIQKKKGGRFDVYAQHEKHARVLAKQLKAFRKSLYTDKPAYQLVLFDFATGTTEDVRTSANKLIMPCLNEANVLNIFSVYEDGPVIWNMEYLSRAIKIIERKHDSYAKKHLSYVRKLNANRRNV
ncbi:NERD domain-containing protein [Anaerotruncus sp. 1XD22-93]|nr:NERD domain-containing protein [Lachnospiraceae bacterium]NBI74252.1 NERD domain-containing protein [Lachnospiraceae bacterium]RKK00359.1 NERD domain-containing protein [Anaerotruncus sp. 1XD22-93]